MKLLVLIQHPDNHLLGQTFGGLVAEREKLMEEYQLFDISILRGALDFVMEALTTQHGSRVIVILDNSIYEQTKESVEQAGAEQVYNFTGNTADELVQRVTECVRHAMLAQPNTP